MLGMWHLVALAAFWDKLVAKSDFVQKCRLHKKSCQSRVFCAKPVPPVLDAGPAIPAQGFQPSVGAALSCCSRSSFEAVWFHDVPDALREKVSHPDKITNAMRHRILAASRFFIIHPLFLMMADFGLLIGPCCETF